MLSSCPFCHIILPSSQLEWHANTHFARDELERDMELAMQISLLPQSLEAMDNPTDCLKPVGHLRRYPCNSDFNNDELNSKDGLEQEISLLVSLQSKSTLYNVEGDLMSLLKKCLESENGNSVSIISGYIDHYQTIESEDIGWGCGWRNIQMLSSHLLAERSDARDVMFGHSGFVPDIPSLQRWLEIAWKRGFDVYGSNFFNQKIYGSRKWIGATECATILRSFGLRARIVDFDGVNSRKQQNTGNSKCKMDANQVYGPMDKFLKGPKHEAGPSSSSNYSEPKIHGPEVLVWVWKYFNCEFGSRLGSSNSVLVSKKTLVFFTYTQCFLPLYFQHDGHSRTIVGIQMQKAKSSSARSYSLLILDPAHRLLGLLHLQLVPILNLFELAKKQTSSSSLLQVPFISGATATPEGIDLLSLLQQKWPSLLLRIHLVTLPHAIHLGEHMVFFLPVKSNFLISNNHNLNAVNLGQLLVGLTLSTDQRGDSTYCLTSWRTAALKGSLNSNNGWQRMIKRGAHTLKKSQYQLCYVDPGIAAVGEEMEQLKYIDSILVEL
ncbi:hypothetical protein ZIOFF_073047 [Zingiber officinale]|uniref:UFSP1/2/DUB catalytic domain-containing protein n=1 Tax=Zingiber officinale TaxID=94328 RepID=A0A8J5BZK2_ZINOF|nr:hypothetical protein ZIOFF_073047 [Zingiber officinale]